MINKNRQPTSTNDAIGNRCYKRQGGGWAGSQSAEALVFEENLKKHNKNEKGKTKYKKKLQKNSGRLLCLTKEK